MPVRTTARASRAIFIKPTVGSLSLRSTCLSIPWNQISPKHTPRPSEINQVFEGRTDYSKAATPSFSVVVRQDIPGLKNSFHEFGNIESLLQKLFPRPQSSESDFTTQLLIFAGITVGSISLKKIGLEKFGFIWVASFYLSKAHLAFKLQENLPVKILELSIALILVGYAARTWGPPCVLEIVMLTGAWTLYGNLFLPPAFDRAPPRDFQRFARKLEEDWVRAAFSKTFSAYRSLQRRHVIIHNERLDWYLARRARRALGVGGKVETLDAEALLRQTMEDLPRLTFLQNEGAFSRRKKIEYQCLFLYEYDLMGCFEMVAENADDWERLMAKNETMVYHRLQGPLIQIEQLLQSVPFPEVVSNAEKLDPTFEGTLQNAVFKFLAIAAALERWLGNRQKPSATGGLALKKRLIGVGQLVDPGFCPKSSESGTRQEIFHLLNQIREIPLIPFVFDRMALQSASTLHKAPKFWEPISDWGPRRRRIKPPVV